MQRRCFLNGQGSLFNALVKEFQAQTEFTFSLTQPTPADQCAIMLSVYDWWNPERDLKIQQEMRSLECAWLPIWMDFAQLWVGPWVLPAEPGCIACLEERRLRLEGRLEYRHATSIIAQRDNKLLSRHPLSFHALAPVLVAFLQDELSRFTRNQAPRLIRQLFLWDVCTFQIERHSVLPVSGCPHCQPLPEDRPDLVEAPLHPRRKISPEILRVQGRSDDLAGITSQLVSPRTGIIQTVKHTARDSLIVASASVPVVGAPRLEFGVGRTTTVAHSRQVAILEALERSAGFIPGGKRPTLRATYRDLGEQAIDPRRFILYAPEQYAQAGPPLAPFQEDQEYLWVWAYSFAHQRPMAIPEEFAYYGFLNSRGRSTEQPLLVYDLSNGCALGNCLEEAALHGLFEVLERDAFLLTWYARQTPACLDLETAQDRRIPLLVDSLRIKGYETFAFNITQEFAVPTVWVMIVSPDDTPGKVKTISAAGCHLDPERAIWSGLLEVLAGLSLLQENYHEEREYALTLLDVNNNVRAMHDHALLYCLPEAFPRLHFLFTASDRRVSLDEAFACQVKREQTDNLTDDLTNIVQVLLQHNLDVLVFDQTSQEQELLGFKTVRVLVPGSLPMAFGHRLRRYYGCERLLSLVGLSMQSTSDEVTERLNPWPHPFP